MKKIILLIWLGCVLTITSTAQTKWQFSATAGVSIANNTMSRKQAPIADWVVGAFAAYPINELLSLEVEPRLNGKGFRELLTGGSNESIARLTYLGLPVFAKLNLRKGFYVAAGPEINFLLTSNIPFYANYCEKTDIGIAMRLGKDFKQGVGISLGYYVGLNNIITNIDSKNSAVSLQLRYNFGNRKQRA